MDVAGLCVPFDRVEELIAVSRDLPVVEVSCPACESLSSRIAVIKHGFVFARCERCSSVYMNPRPTEASLVELYRRFPDLAGGVEETMGDPRYGVREARYRLRRLTEFCTAGHLLDVGCGRGDFLLEARSTFQVQGVDIAPRLREEAEDIPFIEGRLEDAALRSDSFDVVTVVELLEHLFSPERTLTEVSRILAPRGVLLVQTGDGDSLRARFNLHTWNYVQPPVHLNIFSRKGLANLLRETGFRVVRGWSFGRAPERVLGRIRLPGYEMLRPFLDSAARMGLIGQMYAARKVLIG